MFPAPLTPAETAFIALDDEYHTRLNEFWRQLDELPESTDIDQFCAEHDPKPEYLPKFLAFEREHAGEDVGLDALAEVVSSAVGGGGRDQPEYIARRQVLDRLPRYEDRQLAATEPSPVSPPATTIRKSSTTCVAWPIRRRPTPPSAPRPD